MAFKGHGEQPTVPQGGWTQPDDFLRCTKCIETGQGGVSVGFPVSKVNISLIPDSGPFVAIAEMKRCGKCGTLYGMRLIPGASEQDETGRWVRAKSQAEKHGIALYQVDRCYRQMPIDCFTLNELKSGQVNGATKNNIAYNPNSFIECDNEDELI